MFKLVKTCGYIKGSKGIRQWQNKLMYIPIDNKHDYPFCRLKLVVVTFEYSFNESTNQNSLKSPKLLMQRIRKCYYKALKTSVINSSFSLL